VGQIHERMPVIFNAAAAWDWLKPAATAELQKMLLPYPAEKMSGYVVSTAVNSPALDSIELVRPAE
jgi:putative SOS response-associated peptidase YedK